MITASGITKIYCDHIFKLHGTPQKIISNRGPQFVSSFMTDFLKLLYIEGNPSTTYHPQTNGQTEQFNAMIEQYLCIYINHCQTDWVEWLPLAKFSHNNCISSSTKTSPFLLNTGQTLCIFPMQMIQSCNQNEEATQFVTEMKASHILAKQVLEHATADMKCFYDRTARPP